MAKSKAIAATAGARGDAPAPRPSTAARKRADVAPARSPTLSAGRPPTGGPTKQALIIGLLQRDGGASLTDLVAATGWLAHTTRAALTRLRQAGHVLAKSTSETGITVYRIAPPARPARSRKAA